MDLFNQIVGGMQQWVIGNMQLLAFAAYTGLALVTGWSAVVRRGEGWRAGALFSVLLFLLPAWVGGLLWLFENSGLASPAP